MASEAQKRARKKYQKNNTIMICVQLNKKTDADIIEKISGEESRQGYIKRLVREDIKCAKSVPNGANKSEKRHLT